MSGVFPESGVPAIDANNSLQNPDTVNCENELWHSTARCTPRFDPAAANAVMSEIINLVNCSGLPYDCTKLDNLCIAVQDLIDDKIFGCFTRTFPVLTGACAVEQLVLMTDATGCKKIARYTDASATLSRMNDWSIFPPGYNNWRPLTPTNPATFYTWNDLIADIKAHTINESLLSSNQLSHGSFVMNCDGNVWFTYTAGTRLDPNANSGNGTSSVMVTRIDGEFQLTDLDAIFPNSRPFTNFNNVHEATVGPYFFTKGTHFVQTYVVAFGNVPTQVAARGEGVTPGSGLTIKVA